MSSLIPYRYTRNAIDPFFNDDFFRSFFGQGREMNQSFRVDVRDEGDHFLMEAELPGMKRDQIHIDVDDGTLTISAEMKEENQREENNYVLSERRYGQMKRSFTLDQVDEEHISAEYTDGVLKLTLPKRNQPEITRRRIEIH